MNYLAASCEVSPPGRKTLRSKLRGIYPARNKEDKNIKLPCRRCGLATNHVIKHVETVANDAERAFLDDRYEVVKCLGCDCVTIRHLFSELDYIDDEIKTNAVFYPPLTFRKWPEWAKSLDQTLQDLLYQVYVAVHHCCPR